MSNCYQIERAKTICGRCKVSAHCLDWAIETNQHDGIWGGKSETNAAPCAAIANAAAGPAEPLGERRP
ncbi:MAG: WhiB family transcriptional regulator [Egibacteraceae bacterium]